MFARRTRASDEKRILLYVESQNAISETSVSIANKLNVDLAVARLVLDHLVEAGILHRREFGDIESIYYRYPSLEERAGA